jgi:4-amino-4-deoxy-L-arabinose transferase-like glycosyltransferase
VTRLPDSGAAVRWLAAFWLVVSVALAAWGVSGGSPVTEVAPGTARVTLFERRPNAGILSLWLHWDAPAGRTTWAVAEAETAWSGSAEMSWRRQIHPGWNFLVWPDLWTLPAEEGVRLRVADAGAASWRVSAPRADVAYGLHHLARLRGLLLALALAALVALARAVDVAAWRAAARAWRWWLAVAGVAALAAWLRLHTLGLQSLWFDEVLTAIGVQNLAWVVYTPQIFGHPPLSYLLTWAVGGHATGELWLRLPALVAGCATVVALASLGRTLLGPRTGAIAAFGLCLAPLHVEISQLARPYAPFLLLTVLSMEALARAVDRPRALAWLGFSSLAALTVYTHYLGLQVLVLEAVMAAALLARRRWRGTTAALLSFAGVIVLVGPWLPVLRRLGSAQLGQGDVPALFLQELVTRVFVFQFLGPGMGTIVGLGLIAAGAWSLRRRPDLLLVTLPWLVLPLAILWLAQPAHFIAGRHLAFVLPILMLLLGHGVSAVANAAARAWRTVGTAARRHQRLATAAAAVLMIVAWGTPTAEALRGYYHGREGPDWRTVASLLDRLVAGDDRVVATVGAVYPLRHYWSLRVEELASVGFPGIPETDGRRSWVVTHAGRGRPPELDAWLQAHAVLVGEVPASWSLPGVEIYRLRPAAPRRPFSTRTAAGE